MSDYVLNASYAMFLWWFSTGLVLYLNRRPQHSFARSLIAASFIVALALIGLAWSSAQETVFGAYFSFTCGLLIYAWHELTYYMGVVTGPRKTACEPGCRGWRHFGHAIQATLYHEIAIIIGALLVFFICRDAPNQIGMWTYLMLWVMQTSAKLNVFLGARNLSEEFLPSHMQYLKSFLKQRSMNALFPFSIVGGSAVTYWLLQLTLAAEPGSFAAAGLTLLTSLMALAVLEHWFLFVPLQVTALWQWWLSVQEPVRNGGSRTRQTLPVTDFHRQKSDLLRSTAIAVECTDPIDKKRLSPARP